VLVTERRLALSLAKDLAATAAAVTYNRLEPPSTAAAAVG
jgi:hypothetical protein